MPRRPDIHEPPVSLAPEETEAVFAELDRILASPHFRSSRRCQTLLRRIVEQTVSGNVDSLKERVLGVEVFGRAADYDTSHDPVVRATAAEIRKKLAQHYVELPHETGPRIELPAGSYHADVHLVSNKLKEPAPPAPARRRKRIAIAFAAVVLLLAAASALTILGSSYSPLDDLWSPILKAPGAVLVCIGLQAAYNPRAANAQDAIQGLIPHPPARPISEEDLVLLRDRYVALDDALCLVRLTTLLERFGRPYRIRAGPSTSFADLRDTPAVLIGAFDNPWTLRTAGQLRFTFSKDSEQDTGMVRDAQHPENTQWKLTNYWPHWDVPVDYAIVTRMVDTTTDRPVIIVAGLTQYGTIGAGEFVTNPEYFSEAARRLPDGWKTKNLQIVLTVPVVHRTAGRPRVLATHVW